MFNVNITGSSAIPGTVQVPASSYASAVNFYKARLRASTSSSSSRYTTLSSAYGIRFRVMPINASSSPSKVRIILNPNVDRSRIARALSLNGSYRRTRAGLVVVDVYGVSWTIA